MSKIWTATARSRYGDCLERQKSAATITSSSSAPVKKAIEDEEKFRRILNGKRNRDHQNSKNSRKKMNRRSPRKSFWPSQDEDVEDLDDDGKESAGMVIASNTKKSAATITSSSSAPVKKAIEDDEEEGFWKVEDDMSKTGEGTQIIDDLEEEKSTHRKPDGSIDYDYPRVHDKPKVVRTDVDMLRRRPETSTEFGGKTPWILALGPIQNSFGRVLSPVSGR